MTDKEECKDVHCIIYIVIIVIIGTCIQCGVAIGTGVQEMQWDFPIHTK